MDGFTLLFWIISIALVIWAIIKDKKSTFKAAKKSKAMMGSMIGEIIAIILLIGLIITLVPPETIKRTLGSADNFMATIVAALVGSITLIPAFVAFPLVGSLVDAGASIVPAVAFLTTLTMVGVVTFPLEKNAFGLKFALVRNVASFVSALLISIAMGVIL